MTYSYLVKRNTSAFHSNTHTRTFYSWATSRDSKGQLVADPKAFPNGIKPVADYVHSKVSG